LAEGEQTYEVTVTDNVGNESDPTDVTLTVDTIVPAAPTVTSPISGTAVMTDTPTFEGAGEPGGEVNVYDEGGSVVCTTTVAQDGTWSCTPDNPIDEGEQTYDVTVTDDAGNESDPTPVTLDVDTTVPAAPAVTAPISGTAVMTDTPTFEGTGEVGGEVTIIDEGGSTVCTTTVAQDGSWSCTPSAPLAEGEQTYEVTVTDDAGNESDPTPVTLDVDTTAPAAPTVTSPISGTAVMTDTPTFEGTGEPGGEVTITDEGGSTVCTTTVAQDGSWSCTPSAPLAEGEQTYEVTVTDDVGNESDRTEVTLDVDTTAPDAPTVTSPISGTVTSGTPIFEGTGEAGGEVNVYDDNGTVVCTTTVAQDGTWSCTPSTPLDEGEQTYDVTVTDDAGNESDPTPVTLDVDTTAPSTPAVTSPITGTIVMTDTPTFEGTGEPGGEVTITDEGGNAVCTTTVAQDGAWSCTPDTPLAGGKQTYVVTITDEVGNASAPIHLTLDVDPTATDLAIAQSIQITGMSRVTYTLVAENLGLNPADDAVISDTLTHMTDVAWTCVAAGGAAPATGSGTGDVQHTITTFPVNGVVTCTVTGTLTDWGHVTNTAEIVPPDGIADADEDNNRATVERWQYAFPLVFKNYTP
jgi:phage protein D